MTEAEGSNTETARLPPFYRRPRPLDAATDQGLALKTPADFSFARAAMGVVIGPAEFAPALRHYPIVFTLAAPPAALAIVAVEAERNLFVDADGTWRRGAYVPAYVRRYPFIFLERPQSDQLVLCIDEASDLLTHSAGRPLYENGEPTALLEEALAFGRDFLRETRAGTAFVAALKARDLLVPNAARIRLADGRHTRVADFHIIDEGRFNALPDDLLLEWRRRGWLALIYAHLFSMANWAGLAELAAGNAAAGA